MKRSYVRLTPEQQLLPKKEKNAIYEKRKQRKYRLRYLDGYGGKCACCGEARLEFLEVHHIDGGGTKERVEAGKGSRLARKKIKEGFPPGLEVLCCNCHNARELYGSCPHEVSRTGN